LTREPAEGTLAPMAPHRPDDDADSGDDLTPAEAARDRRRDHDAAASARSGMRTGLAKQFKQVLDAQVRRAHAAGAHGMAEGSGEAEGGPEPPPKKRGHRGRAPHSPAPPG
jgi:hypothetical protein